MTERTRIWRDQVNRGGQGRPSILQALDALERAEQTIEEIREAWREYLEAGAEDDVAFAHLDSMITEDPEPPTKERP